MLNSPTTVSKVIYIQTVSLNFTKNKALQLLAQMFHLSHNSHILIFYCLTMNLVLSYENNDLFHFYPFWGGGIRKQLKTFHHFTCWLQSLCHCHFNDLFIDSVRGWIYFNKYTAVWQTAFGLTECFIRMDKIDRRGRGGFKKTEDGRKDIHLW